MAVLSLSLLVLFATAPMLAHGKEPRKCRPGSGKCVEIFRTSDFATFRYGQYCGFANKNKPGVKDPCNDLDRACLMHDRCLGSIISERCACDAGLILNALASGADTGTRTGLCEPEFYTTSGIRDGFEGFIVATPFCCQFLGDSPICTNERAATVCSDIGEELLELGIDLNDVCSG